MPDSEFPFAHFPLDAPEYKEQVWTQQASLSTLLALLDDPHAWIRSNTDRAPEQLLGRHFSHLLLQFIYPAEAPTPGTFVAAGTLTGNKISIYMPLRLAQDAREDEAFFVGVAREEAQELTVILHDGLAFACHYPFPPIERRQALEYITRSVVSPDAYLRALNDERFFRLVPGLPHPGYGIASELPPIDRLRFALAGGNLQGIRFVFQWTRPVGFQDSADGPEPPAPSCLKLMGTYERDVKGELEIVVDTLAAADMREPGPPSPPGLVVQKQKPAKGKTTPPLKPNTKKRRK